MKMIEAKKEIEDKLFQGAPLSLDAMICALGAINEYIDKHGTESFMELNINVGDEVKCSANNKLNEELQKGVDSAEKYGWIDAEDVRKHFGFGL